ncbi:uncharacterized protein BDZ99DRAFT_38472 [Mytilinidion resinicola]|uniref:WSC domain-containing protein n=1 Tax=Mytilinidion resinicola TaxID=574789 RepID=A0A6A6YIV7_9PEZI|nr:uncharacterized protein BDZ99DRAFT_38472 [Mytilinidion resinicola]KAF2808731.1 hypothetical protein BDZ99DRAFT_38472 [Mytilinidion resinicola]
MHSLITPVLALVLAIVFVRPAAADALFQSYCSSENTGSDSDAKFWTWQSNGWCHDQCVSSYAFAIVQGNNCWCSNYVPADTTSVSNCNVNCPGYPDEQCGNEADGLFGYVALNNKPSGTLGAAGSTSSSAMVSTSQLTTAIPSSAAISTPTPEVGAPSLPTLTSPISSYPSKTQASSFSQQPSKPTHKSPSPSTFLIIRSTSLVIVSSFVVLSTYLTIPFVSSSAPPSSSSPQSHDDPETVFRTVTETPSQAVSSAVLVSSTVISSSSSSSAQKTSVAPSTTTQAPSSSTTSSATSWTPTPITSVQIVTVSGSVVTKTVTGMSTQPAEIVQKKHSTSGGAIAGAVIGSLAGLALVGALLFWFFFWRKRQSDKTKDSEAAGNPPQRNTSTMSRTGLLGKSEKPSYPPVITNLKRSSTQALDQSASISPASDRRNSRPLFYDQRLNPSALMDLDNGSHTSILTIEDNRDYTRTLNVRNPDPSNP